MNQLQPAATKTLDLSFTGLLLQADIVVQLVSLLLVLGSIWSWAIVINKMLLLKRIERKMQQFDDEFWSGVSLEKFFQKVRGKDDNPLAIVFCAGMKELELHDKYLNFSQPSVISGMKERVLQGMQVSAAKVIEEIEQNVTFLAIASSSAPFIGLFGTVWGIMISFQSIALSKNTTLAVVAPGIAEALLATALGLVVAIPAMIFYNKLTTDINKIGMRIEHFIVNFVSIISRQVDAHQIQTAKN
ncbi:protein TolQ [Rickettsiales endosymbiont of Peranema trichophorum]|nr:protein TolQ [Rickettsiales endosymbiont of Peranema trichophorum]